MKRICKDCRVEFVNYIPGYPYTSFICPKCHKEILINLEKEKK